MEGSEEMDDGEGADEEEEERGPTQHTDSAYESGEREKTKVSASSEEKKKTKAKKIAPQEVSD